MARRSRSGQRGIPVTRLQKKIASGDPDPVYLLLGEEEFLRRRALAALIAAVVDPDSDEAEIAVERIDLESSSLAAAIDAARSLSLFLDAGGSPSRVVVVRGFDGGRKEEAGLLGDYLDDPVTATCLVFDVPKLDARRVAAKALLAGATVVDCSPPEREADVRKWLQGAAGAHGFRVQREALDYLLETVGTDLQQLDQELEKISLLVSDRDDPEVEARDLEALMGRSREYSVFDLTDRLVEGDAVGATRILNHLLDDGEAPERLLAMVAWIVRQLVTAQDLAARGCPEKELLGQLGGRWDQRRRVLTRARTIPSREVEKLLVECARADTDVKMRRHAARRGTLEALCRRVCTA